MTAIRAVECLDETALAHYEHKMEKACDYIDRASEFSCISMFSYLRAQQLIDDAVAKLCDSIKDGSLYTGQRCVIAPRVAS